MLFAVGLGATAASAAKTLRRGRRTPARTLHTLYWALVAAAVIAAFVVTDVVSGADTTSDRYLIPVYLAVAAVVPLTAGRAASCLVVELAALGICAASVFALANADLARRKEALPLAQQGPLMIRTIEHDGLIQGYSWYWDAASLTWKSGLRLQIAPIAFCDRTRVRLCPVMLNSARAWYQPHARERTFVIVDPTFENAAAIETTARRLLGRPAARRRFGSIVVLEYSYDIASRLSGPWSAHRPMPRTEPASTLSEPAGERPQPGGTSSRLPAVRPPSGSGRVHAHGTAASGRRGRAPWA